jgi:hypothetical protein
MLHFDKQSSNFYRRIFHKSNGLVLGNLFLFCDKTYKSLILDVNMKKTVQVHKLGYFNVRITQDLFTLNRM